MNKEKLLPCPMCGGEAKIDSNEIINERYDPDTLAVLDYEHNDNPDYTVCCVHYCVMTVPCESKEEAIAAWNKRTPDIVYCPECVYGEASVVIVSDKDIPIRLCYCKLFGKHTLRTSYCSFGWRKQEDE